MSTFDRIGTFSFCKIAALALSVTVLSACGSIGSFKDFTSSINPDVEQMAPRDFITTTDLARVQLGMSPLQVKKQLGAPMLGENSKENRWDYILKNGEGASEEFVPFGIHFKDKKVVLLAHLRPPTQLAQAPLDASATASGVLEPQPTAAVGSDIDDASSINDMLSNWAAAWSAKDVNGYLSFYADTFEHRKSSRKAWEKQRRERLSGPVTLSVEVSDIEIDVQSETLALVKFKQVYRSNRFKDVGIKVLTLSKANGTWKIQSEDFQK